MDVIKVINGFAGADWGLGKIIFDGENIFLHFFVEKGEVTIGCRNFIGFSFIGNWDEGVIENIRIESEGDLIDSSLKEIERLHGETIYIEHPAFKKMNDIWYQLNVKLVDGNVIKVACESFDYKTMSYNKS